MILLDSNVLVAMSDLTDELHSVAISDSEAVAHERMALITPVLAEACYLLRAPRYWARMTYLIESLGIEPFVPANERILWDEAFSWMLRYAEHKPDWVDACLAVLCGRDKRLKVWTYDEEFATIWRRPDGTKIPLAVKKRG